MTTDLFTPIKLGGIELNSSSYSPKFDLIELRKNFSGPYMANFGYDKARANAALAA